MNSFWQTEDSPGVLHAEHNVYIYPLSHAVSEDRQTSVSENVA